MLLLMLLMLLTAAGCCRWWWRRCLEGAAAEVVRRDGARPPAGQGAGRWRRKRRRPEVRGRWLRRCVPAVPRHEQCGAFAVGMAAPTANRRHRAACAEKARAPAPVRRRCWMRCRWPGTARIGAACGATTWLPLARRRIFGPKARPRCCCTSTAQPRGGASAWCAAGCGGAAGVGPPGAGRGQPFSFWCSSRGPAGCDCGVQVLLPYTAAKLLMPHAAQAAASSLLCGAAALTSQQLRGCAMRPRHQRSTAALCRPAVSSHPSASSGDPQAPDGGQQGRETWAAPGACAPCGSCSPRPPHHTCSFPHARRKLQASWPAHAQSGPLTLPPGAPPGVYRKDCVPPANMDSSRSARLFCERSRSTRFTALLHSRGPRSLPATLPLTCARQPLPCWSPSSGPACPERAAG